MSKPHAHLHSMQKTSAKFQNSPLNTVRGVVSTKCPVYFNWKVTTEWRNDRTVTTEPQKDLSIDLSSPPPFFLSALFYKKKKKKKITPWCIGCTLSKYKKRQWSGNNTSQLMRLWYLSHRRPAKALARLRGCAGDLRSLARAFAVRTHDVWK